MAHDLTTAEGLRSALNDAGNSWAELSRMTCVPPSTLKSWGRRLGVSRTMSTALAEVQRPDAGELQPTRRGVGARDETERLLAAMAEDRRQSLEAVITGDANELDFDKFWWVVELGTPLMLSDHQRLQRAASLAIQYYRKNPAGHKQPKFMRMVAAACQVDAKELPEYVRLQQKENEYRKSHALLLEERT